MNNAVFIARVQADPAIRATSKGDTVANFKVLTEGDRPEDPNIELPVTCYGACAEHVRHNIRAGQWVWLRGQLQIYVNPETKAKNATLVASRVDAVGRPEPAVSGRGRG